MPQLVFDVYMANKLSHLFTLYLHKRSGTKWVDHNLTDLKKKAIGEELETCRLMLMGEVDGKTLPWEQRLEKLKDSFRGLVAGYDEKTGTQNSQGQLVDLFLKEAETFYTEVKQLFSLFGLENATVEEMDPYMYRRQLLLEQCIGRLYAEGQMDPTDWQNVASFRVRMENFCRVASKDDEEVKPEVKKEEKKEEKTSEAAGKAKGASKTVSASPLAPSMTLEVKVPEKTPVEIAPKQNSLHFKKYGKLAEAVRIHLSDQEKELKASADTSLTASATSVLVRSSTKALAAANQVTTKVLGWLYPPEGSSSRHSEKAIDEKYTEFNGKNDDDARSTHSNSSKH